MKKLQN